LHLLEKSRRLSSDRPRVVISFSALSSVGHRTDVVLG
jgi:hypothetical protein